MYIIIFIITLNTDFWLSCLSTLDRSSMKVKTIYYFLVFPIPRMVFDTYFFRYF